MLSARPCEGELGRPDERVDDVVASVILALSSWPGARVVHRSVDSAAGVIAALRQHRPDLVFNLCESMGGDSRKEASVCWLLERLGVAFTGSRHDTLRACLYKSETHQILRRAGVRVPATIQMRRPDDPIDLPLPAIVKPDREDGSIGIDQGSVVYTARALRDRVAELVERYRQPAVAQAYIAGRELSVSLLGAERPRAMPIGEIDFRLPPGLPRILTYASKWDEGSVEHEGTVSVAAELSPAEQRRIGAIGRWAFDALGGRDYGRVDLRLDPQGVAHVIDVNPNCDLSAAGGFARAAVRAGLSHPELLRQIALGALARARAGRWLEPDEAPLQPEG